MKDRRSYVRSLNNREKEARNITSLLINLPPFSTRTANEPCVPPVKKDQTNLSYNMKIRPYLH